MLLSWSSGKDSAWSLHCLKQNPDIDVAGLLTTVTEPFDRVSMHGVRRDILAAQARAAGLPLIEVPIPAPCPNETYESRMGDAMARARDDDVDTVAFGDLFLEDVRAYREKNLNKVGMHARFPIWGIPTGDLSREMVSNGLRAVIVSLDPKVLDRSFAGRIYDETFLADLPAGIDPCGEKGEFHTLVYAGPMFDEPLDIEVGEIVERDGFVFTDVTLAA